MGRLLFKHHIDEADVSSAEAIRNLNRRQVLEAVRTSTPISLNELTRRIPLSRATVSSIVNEMKGIGLLREAGQAASTGGRRPTLYDYHPQARMAMGVTMFDNEVKAVLTDLEGTPLEYRENAWEGQRIEDLIDVMISTVNEFSQSTDDSCILGVGVGLPGVVDVTRGVVVERITGPSHIDGPVDARTLIEAALHLPTIVTNRSRAAALGELQVGVGRDFSNILYLFIGRGIVASIVLDGDIFFGPNFSAGEIGHNTVVPGGHLCGCGNYGCLEMYATDSAIVARANAKARATPDSAMRLAVDGNLQLLSSDIIIRCARQGDPAALQVLDRTGEYLGIALSAAINLLNPELLILGGPIGCKAGPLLLDPTIREIERHTLSIPLSNLKIVSGSEETECAATGAAVLALKNANLEDVFSRTDLRLDCDRNRRRATTAENTINPILEKAM